jgi:hypothetical protein
MAKDEKSKKTRKFFWGKYLNSNSGGLYLLIILNLRFRVNKRTTIQIFFGSIIYQTKNKEISVKLFNSKGNINIAEIRIVVIK